MYLNSNRNVLSMLSLAAVLAIAPIARGQFARWDFFEIPGSSFGCDVVNASNAELVVLSDTGELAILTASDQVILLDTFVDLDNNVFFGPDQTGFLTFADDGEGFETLWWVSLTGRVVEVDGFSGEPFETNFLPSDLLGFCDACDIVTDPVLCADPFDPDPVLPPPVIPGPISLNFCGAGTALTMIPMFASMLAIGLVRRRFG